MADWMLSDVRSLLTTMKLLDSTMKTSLKTLQAVKVEPKGALPKKAVPWKTGKKGVVNEGQKIEQIIRNNKVIVSVGTIFMKIDFIDTIHDRFQAEVNVILKWREPLLDGTQMEADDVDWSLYWNPKVCLANGIGEPRSKISMSISYDIHGRATVRESRQMSGWFFEFMELHQFPFDRQDLTITLVSERDVSEVQLVEDLEERCGINAKAFSSEQEWKLYKEVNVWRKTVVKKANKMTKKYPGFNTAAKSSRRPQFFIWNIIVIMRQLSDHSSLHTVGSLQSIICSMAFTTFVVNFNTPHFRLQLTFILLLTTVTFKFAVNKNLPKISYLTLMDKYILSSMLILFCVCAWHAVIGGITRTSTSSTSTTTTTTPSPPVNATASLPDSTSTGCSTASDATSSSFTDVVDLADKIALGVLLSLYVLLHFILAVVITCCNSDEDDTSQDNETDDEILKKQQDTSQTLGGYAKTGNKKQSTEILGYDDYGD